MKTIFRKIADKSAVAGVIGLGYVGLPLAVQMAKAGFKTTGFDLDEGKVNAINDGKNYIQDIDSADLSKLVGEGLLKATADFRTLGDCDFISICVPTPLGKGKDPDISFIVRATTQVKERLRPRQVIILESTTYPGTTDEVVLPLLEESGLKVGKDIFLAFSPERIDPGNKQFTIKNTPKVIGGITPHCTEIAQSFYQIFIDQVIPVGGTRSAEMVKLLENTFRAVNIGLANEIAIMCNHLGIDTWEVIEAARTKPFGFMPFYPGPGLGGHCIPVDPQYLLWKLKSMNYNARFIQLADEINSSMPHLVVDKIVAALSDQKKPLRDAKILLLGVAYKQDIGDHRESPALDVIHLLTKKGADVAYHDPYIPELNEDKITMTSVTSPYGGTYDCVVLLTHHSSYDMEKIVVENPLIIDTRNATRHVQGHSHKIIKI